MRDLSEAIKASISAAGTRQSLGANPTWGAIAPPILLPQLVTQIESDRLSFSSVDISRSGAATVVAPGAAKPAVATITVTQRAIGKVAARADVQMESFWESEDVISGVLSTLFSACAATADTNLNTALNTATPDATPAANWIAAISGGQAAVVAAGGAPQLVVIPSSKWPALAGELAGAAGLSTSSSDAILAVLGSRIVLSPAGTKAFVLDPGAASTVTRDVGFVIGQAATTNVVQVVADLVQTSFVSNPALAAEIAVGTP